MPAPASSVSSASTAGNAPSAGELRKTSCLVTLTTDKDLDDDDIRALYRALEEAIGDKLCGYDFTIAEENIPC